MKSHIDQIREKTEAWLDEENEALQDAVHKTVEAGLFSKQDIDFQLSVLRDNIKNGDLEEWAGRSGLNDQQHAKGKKVLCLHAGNLPLVGFQTALGAILSGAEYYGKLSRKDPYLLASFLDELNQAGLNNEIKHSTELTDFTDLLADEVVFAGSEESIPEVEKTIKELKAAKTDADYIIRTAKFSIAYLEEWNEKVKRDLVEAMLRYGGKGCRSVANVVAEFGLDEVKDELGESIWEFWTQNPQHQSPAIDLRYQYAYNEAIGRNQLWMKDFLIQEAEELPDLDFSVNWVKGGEAKVTELREQFGKKVQSVYMAGKDIENLETEELGKAQRPPLYWKPDGVDLVRNLI